MKIAKVINNNVISVLQEDGAELVVMGRGIAFKKKPGDKVDESRIEKVFALKNKQTSDNFKMLLREVPIELIVIVEEIIDYAKKNLPKKLNENIYVSLTDHINFAVERHQQGLEIKNALLWEIKQLYKEEFSIGLKTLERIKLKLGIDLPEDEAAFIAIHIVNAEMNEEVGTTMDITKFIQQIINIVKYHFGTEFEEDSLSYLRFITHLKFFAQRVLKGTHYREDYDNLFDLIKEKHREAAFCAEKIKKFVEKEYNHKLTNEEMLYLTVHIERVVNR
ncbi:MULTISPECIES: BglG family transcription antiterminator LicT [Paenibacillus]|uniref:PRD domain-containing protein n=1 Tax=Paenibacillus macerans TaxID=44252 RepID=A0A6N8F2Z9_PAEMA|nr:PRD domain-containing protein [Paenibacillus macerans]MEC0333131.1 PRD domain-containing protein [Paenibacillus macerans]MUG26786.1 PRD domain-containing protein [Paenibacillus macerans]UMV49472.1 PRD domain-containing protein [Paenibacillus macerans]GBK63598.1 transcription antiterminator LicT [Paenibacillus macerans]GBK69911.1 transcription antiterminator LicT [Paenibacillus macerans]